MDEKKQSFTINQMTLNHKAQTPAQLWIGRHEELVDKVISFLQKILCNKNGCKTCITCQQINKKEHHAITWLYPDKKYTLDQLKVIFETVSFLLNPGQYIFFIIQKADFLSTACSNSLLKSLEEPPSGYHFILLAEREDLILPTIRSRCITQLFYSQTEAIEHHALFEFFTSPSYTNPITFTQILQQTKINERESFELIDNLLAHWIKKFEVTLEKNQKEENNTAQQVIEKLKIAMITPPMPGSSKIFWKNLFLQIKS